MTFSCVSLGSLSSDISERALMIALITSAVSSADLKLSSNDPAFPAMFSTPSLTALTREVVFMHLKSCLGIQPFLDSGKSQVRQAGQDREW